MLVPELRELNLRTLAGAVGGVGGAGCDAGNRLNIFNRLQYSGQTRGATDSPKGEVLASAKHHHPWSSSLNCNKDVPQIAPTAYLFQQITFSAPSSLILDCTLAFRTISVRIL